MDKLGKQEQDLRMGITAIFFCLRKRHFGASAPHTSLYVMPVI